MFESNWGVSMSWRTNPIDSASREYGTHSPTIRTLYVDSYSRHSKAGWSCRDLCLNQCHDPRGHDSDDACVNHLACKLRIPSASGLKGGD